MKNINYKNKPLLIITLGFLLIIGMTGCKKLVEVNTPPTNTNAGVVFSDDGTAAAVMTGVFARMTSSNIALTSLSIYSELSADNLVLFGINLQNYAIFYRNNLTPLANTAPNYWQILYQQIYNVNTVIENAGSSTKLSQKVKDRLLGEAYFVRAFSYYYLVNLFGDVPLVTTIDYKKSSQIGRTPVSEVMKEVINDLKQAKILLGENYVDANLVINSSDRVRPNRFAAAALLARSYLYLRDYVNAEAEASLVINNATVYDTVPLNETFTKNKKETIWALMPVTTGENTKDGRFYTLPATGPNTFTNPFYLSTRLLSKFEANDKRRTMWVGSVTAGGTTYYFPSKYKIATLNQPVNEFTIVLRYAEQLLIRSEARAQQNKIPEAQADLNKIRTRAGLGNTPASNREELLLALQQERRVELFTEWGHRWLDLKRLDEANEVMAVATAEKGGVWKSDWQLYPIPLQETLANTKLGQNQGYQQ